MCVLNFHHYMYDIMMWTMDTKKKRRENLNKNRKSNDVHFDHQKKNIIDGHYYECSLMAMILWERDKHSGKLLVD